MFTIILLNLDFESLDLVLEVIAFDLIISNSLIGSPQVILAIFEVLLTLGYLLLSVKESLLVVGAVILQTLIPSFELVHLLLSKALPSIKFLNGLNLLLHALQSVLGEHAVLVEVLHHLTVVFNLVVLIIVLK